MMMTMMKIQVWASVLLISSVQSADALGMYDPKLCYILDGVLGIYGLFITGMFIKERFFRSKVRDQRIHSDVGMEKEFRSPRDAERGRMRRLADDSTYTDLTGRTDGEYKELPIKRDRQKKNEQVYQGLNSASRDTYNTLQLQPLPVH